MFDMVAEVRAFAQRLQCADLWGLDDAARVDLIRALEEAKCVAEATQAWCSADLDASQRAMQAERGVARAQQGRGVDVQVAWARRESPHRGRQHLSLARILRSELPHTLAAFRAGRISEWRAMVIARETACLALADRLVVDRAIAGDPEALEGYSDRVVTAELKKLAARLDPASVAERRRRAESERCVTLRPAPDTMSYLTVLLPVASAVAVYAALAAAADSATARGTPRSRGQVMADTLVGRVTGASTADGRPALPVSLGLVMSDHALLEGAHDTAHLEGHGPIPAGLARELVAAHLDTGSSLWLRRLYTRPVTGELLAMDARQRLFRGQLRRFLDLRDQFCRHPWCGAPIRHRDHATAVAEGGLTTAEDGQGLCQTCNHAKQAPGWRARPSPGAARHAVETTTPTGHTYRSQAPPLLDLRRGRPRSRPRRDLSGRKPQRDLTRA